MKKNFYLIVFCLFVFATAKAQYVTINDTVFRDYLANKYPSCFNAVKQMDTVCAATNIDTVNMSGRSGSAYLLRFFKTLKYLDFSNISVSSGKSTATSVFFASNLTFPNTLQYLDLSNNAVNMWQVYYDWHGDPQSSHYDIFSKFPDSLKVLKCNNVTFYENYITDTYTYGCGYNNFPALPNKLEHLEYSFLNISGQYSCANGSNSFMRFSTRKFPNTLKVLKVTQLPSNGFAGGGNYNVLLDTVLPTALKTLICNDCSFGNFQKLFSTPNLPSLDTLIIPNSYALISYLPNSIKYIDMGQPSYLYMNNNSRLDTLPYTLDSLQYLNIVGNSNRKLNLNAKNLKTLFIGGNNLLTDFTLVNDSLKSLNTFGCSIKNINVTNTNLKYLNCSNNGVKFWSQLPATLDTLIMNNDSLTSLTNLSANISYINCSNNIIQSHTTLPITLKYFDCSSNKLAAINNLPNGLQYLDCSNMSINAATNTKLNSITNFPNSLQYINCSNNSLVYLPPMSTAATKILCNSNLLHALPALPNSLKYLDCSNNYFLTTMPTLSNVLDTLKCNINNLTRLPGLPASLKYLDCSKNAMTYLPELPDGLSYLHCWNNDFYCLPKLPSALSEFWVSTLHIACMPNTVSCDITEVHDSYGTGYYNAVLNPAPPLCNPASNANQCKFKPVMEGNIYYDINGNGIKDANEYYSKNVKVQSSNGTYTFTDNNGHYELSADSLGDYTIKIAAPKYYVAMPDTFHYTFTQYNASVSELVALQPSQSIDSLNIKITPWQNCARPAGNLDYIINYENVGTNNLSPIINFSYDSSLLTYIKSSNNSVTNSGNKLTLNIGSLAVGQTGGFTASFIVKSTDTLGSIIDVNTNILGGSTIAVDSVSFKVKSSFDPNDKQATPVLTPLQVYLGKFIDYTIRFQNTGNDTAFNIVLTDTLSNKLLHQTLEMRGSSHNCKATVKDNIAVFEFLNINLPDSNMNSLKSHGFVNFRVKPLSSLSNGDVVPNNASIYFDYNQPVITNTALTFINTTGIVTPVKLLGYNARLINEHTVENAWQTSNENGCSHYNIQKSLDGIRFENIGKVLAGKNNYTFNDVLIDYMLQKTIFYRLQIMDKDGSYAYSPIKRIQLNGKQPAIAIYPNPARDFVSIEASSIRQIKVIDNFGKILISKNFDGSTISASINISSLHKGFYVVQVIDKNGDINSDKLVVE